MTFRDDILPDVLAIRGIPEAFGIRTITVKLRVETWSADINTPGATLSSTSDLVVTPRPKVRLAGEEVAVYYGAGPPDGVTGVGSANIYEVGPITPACTAGGYSVLDLLRNTTTTAARRVLLLLAGDGIGATATTDVVHEIVRIDSTRPFRQMLTVRQAAQTAASTTP